MNKRTFLLTVFALIHINFIAKAHGAENYCAWIVGDGIKHGKTFDYFVSNDMRDPKKYVASYKRLPKDVRKKADKLKKLGYWSDVREVYKKLKNQYLSNQDNNHPSFTVYVEAVNRVYDRI